MERRNPKDLSNYQNLIELFVNLRDGNLNSKEALKSQINFKSDLGKIKKQNQKSKTEDQISLIQNVQKLLDLRGKIVDFLKIIFFCYLNLNTNCANCEMGLKIFTTKQMFQVFSIALAQVNSGNTFQN